MTYLELKQKIRDYTEVSSTVFTDTIIQGFIEDAEFRILRDVDSDNNRRYASANLIASTRFIDTPTDALIIRSAQIVDSALPDTDQNREFLQWRDVSFMSEFNPTTTWCPNQLASLNILRCPLCIGSNPPLTRLTFSKNITQM